LFWNDERMNRGITLQRRLNQQRVKHIIESFQLSGTDAVRFDDRLDELFAQYPSTWLELAIAEVVVVNWLIVPLPRGLAVLRQVSNLLQQWDCRGVTHLLTPDEFQRITGLDAEPVFRELRSHPSLKF
jgi:hypothetical protein